MSPFCRICGLPLRGESDGQKLARICLDGEAFWNRSRHRTVSAVHIKRSDFGASAPREPVLRHCEAENGRHHSI